MQNELERRYLKLCNFIITENLQQNDVFDIILKICFITTFPHNNNYSQQKLKITIQSEYSQSLTSENHKYRCFVIICNNNSKDVPIFVTIHNVIVHINILVYLCNLVVLYIVTYIDIVILDIYTLNLSTSLDIY